MDPTALLRTLQIDLILDNPNPIIEYFNDIWDKLSVIEIDVFHKNGGEFIYYGMHDVVKEHRWVFMRDDANDKFLACFFFYTDELTEIFDINIEEVPLLTKILVENALNKHKHTNNFISIPRPYVFSWNDSEEIFSALENASGQISIHNGHFDVI